MALVDAGAAPARWAVAVRHVLSQRRSAGAGWNGWRLTFGAFYLTAAPAFAAARRGERTASQLVRRNRHGTVHR